MTLLMISWTVQIVSNISLCSLLLDGVTLANTCYRVGSTVDFSPEHVACSCLLLMLVMCGVVFSLSILCLMADELCCVFIQYFY